MTTPFGELSDEDLARLCLERGAKDDRPYAELFRRHHPAIWRVCYGFVENHQDAEDLVQEVFFKAFRKIAQFKGRSTFKTWLYRIAINTGKNELRRRFRRPQVEDTSVDVISVNHAPETVLLEQTPLIRLEVALERLRPSEREAIVLKDLVQNPYQEIAKNLGISLSAAKMRVQRARLALRAVYQQMERAEESL